MVGSKCAGALFGSRRPQTQARLAHRKCHVDCFVALVVTSVDDLFGFRNSSLCLNPSFADLKIAVLEMKNTAIHNRRQKREPPHRKGGAR